MTVEQWDVRSQVFCLVVVRRAVSLIYLIHRPSARATGLGPGRQANLGGLDGGSPMSHVDFFK